LMRPDMEAGRALRRTWGIPDRAFIIGCVARLDPMKDHANFLTAAALLARADSGVRFVCVGHGSAAYRSELMRRAASLALEDRVLWADEVGDMKAVYNAFDIATLASAFGEGFPNVVGEAMACGVPVAATDVGDVRAIVGGSGEVVPPGNPDLLCAAWRSLRQRLARDPGLRESVRATIVADYSLAAMVRRSEDILTQLVTERPARQIARDFG
jgi:glycosyltransferase involved in cell wall biosynthesis